jgi:DNA-binding NarL/FixJ family response regulator
MIRLFVIEDHPVAITGLRNMFRPARDLVEVTGFDSSVEHVVETIAPETFDILMLDLHLFDTDPVQNVRTLRKHFTSKPVVIFTSEESDLWQRKMFDLGVSAYILKTSFRSEIKAVLEKVNEGKIVFSDFVREDEVNRITGILDKGNIRITEQQRSLLLELSQGKTQKEIADGRKTSISNIEKTMWHLRNKFGAKNNLELLTILRDREIL